MNRWDFCEKLVRISSKKWARTDMVNWALAAAADAAMIAVAYFIFDCEFIDWLNECLLSRRNDCGCT